MPVAKVEERLPADVPPRREVAAENVVAVVVDRAGEVRRLGVEHQREERIRGGARAVAAAGCEVDAVGRADHRVAEPVAGGGELD
jgi:hypothetical protein